MPKPKIVILQGPTGVGKTETALALAHHVPVEIVNADSLQFYRFMDIGTSKPRPAQQQMVPHHLFSILDPDEHFHAARYMELARKIIEEILGRQHVPLVVGGTGLYIRALTRGLVNAPDRNEGLRTQLRRHSSAALFAELERVDPDTAQRLKPNDTLRIIRALEVFYQTGTTLSALQRQHNFATEPYQCLKLTLVRERSELYRRIEQRVDQMLAQGFEQEVRELLARGFSPNLRPLQSIGYRQMVALIQGRLTWETAVHEIKKATKRYAKRQMTWFRHDQGSVQVLLPEEQEQIILRVKNFLNNTENLGKSYK